MTDFNIAVMGEQASGKTSAVRLLKNCFIEKRYQRTFGAELHPFESFKPTGGSVVLWDMPPDNYERYMDRINAVLYVTKKKTPPMLDVPHVIVSNRNHQMDRETLYHSLKSLYEIIP